MLFARRVTVVFLVSLSVAALSHPLPRWRSDILDKVSSYELPNIPEESRRSFSQQSSSDVTTARAAAEDENQNVRKKQRFAAKMFGRLPEAALHTYQETVGKRVEMAIVDDKRPTRAYRLLTDVHTNIIVGTKSALHLLRDYLVRGYADKNKTAAILKPHPVYSHKTRNENNKKIEFLENLRNKSSFLALEGAARQNEANLTSAVQKANSRKSSTMTSDEQTNSFKAQNRNLVEEAFVHVSICKIVTKLLIKINRECNCMNVGEV